MRASARLCSLLRIDHPLIGAPMAGGPSTPALAAEISRAGGLGFLGCAYATPEQILEAGREVRARTDRPFGINVFADVPDGAPVDPAEAITHDMSDEEVDALIGDDPADVIVCGMSHTPFDRVTASGQRVVNVGSVGEAPDQRAGGGGVAHATWIESTPAGVVVEQIVVPLAAEVARAASFG